MCRYEKGSGISPASYCLTINVNPNEPMLITIQRSLPNISPVNLVALALSIFSLGVMAMHPAQADAHTTTAVSALGYESALTDYKSLDGSERTGWKESNETVGEIGGWRVYANEAYKANQAEANADSADNAAIGDVGEALEPAVTTPLPKMNATRLDPASNTPEMSGSPSVSDESVMHAAERPSPPPLTLSYQSALSNYRVYDDNPPGDWRAANDRVREIGGWRTYAKEAYEASKREASMDSMSGASQ